MQEFSFRFQNTKGGGYFLLGILGVPAIMMVLSIWLMAYISWIFYISVPLMIGGIILCFRTFFRVSRGEEHIQVDARGFTSKAYGRVLYEDIEVIPPYGALQAPPPSMRIKLRGGKTIAWIFNPQNPKFKPDLETFALFREVLLTHLKAAGATPEGGVSEIQEISPKTETPVTEPHSNKVVEQLEQHKKRDFKYKYVTIPASLILAVIALSRGCQEDFIQKKRAKDLAGLQDIVLSAEQRYQDNLEAAKALAAVYAQKFGPVYLYSNDPSAQMHFLPELKEDANLPEINVVGLRRTEANKQLQQFIHAPDSATFNLFLNNPDHKFMMLLEHSIDSSTAKIYFALYNPQVTADSAQGGNQTIQQTFRRSLSRPGTLEQVRKDRAYKTMLTILQSQPDTYFYMIVKQEDLNEDILEQLQKGIQQDFKDRGITSDLLYGRWFNRVREAYKPS